MTISQTNLYRFSVEHLTEEMKKCSLFLKREFNEKWKGQNCSQSSIYTYSFYLLWNFRGSIQIDEIPTENYCTLVKVYDYLFQAILYITKWQNFPQSAIETGTTAANSAEVSFASLFHGILCYTKWQVNNKIWIQLKCHWYLCSEYSRPPNSNVP